MTLRIEDGENFVRGQIKYWEDVSKSGGFDIEGIKVPPGTMGLVTYNLEKHEFGYDPTNVRVSLYARLGLYRYNMSKGTNFVFHRLKKYNTTMSCLNYFYITLVASDPASSSLVTFQVGVSEKKYGNLDVECFVARPQADRPLGKETVRPCRTSEDEEVKMPEHWPSDLSNTRVYYQLTESELRDNEDWIRLFLELALRGNDWYISQRLVSRIQILNATIEPVTASIQEPPVWTSELPTFTSLQPRYLNCSLLNLFITFKGLPVARVGEDGEHVQRKVIVTRHIDEDTGLLTLLGGFGFLEGETTNQRPTYFPSVEDFQAEQEGLPPPKMNIKFFDWGKKERMTPEQIHTLRQQNIPMNYEEVMDLKKRWGLI